MDLVSLMSIDNKYTRCVQLRLFYKSIDDVQAHSVEL